MLLFDRPVTEPTPAALRTTPTFQSFFMGGFECATHRRRDGRRLDVIAGSQHDRFCREDYTLLADAGIRTVRDGLRWYQIETTPGSYNWSSFLPMLRASFATGTEVIWDLCHWGTPDWLNPFEAGFPEAFARFAAAATSVIAEEKAAAGITRPTVLCPMNEISFWSWVGGDTEFFFPFGRGRGPELKRQLVRASIAGIHAIRAIDPTTRFVQAEPIIHIAPATRRQTTLDQVAAHNQSQFEAWDMLSGRLEPELGGSDDLLDILGGNYYWNNQWLHNGERTPLGHPAHVPLHSLLQTIHNRYKRPMLITETGVEGDAQIGWLGYICAEVRRAISLGVPLHGICLYPVSDYPGWDDSRHCPSGLLAIGPRWRTRALREDLVAEVQAQRQLFAPSIS